MSKAFVPLFFAVSIAASAAACTSKTVVSAPAPGATQAGPTEPAPSGDEEPITPSATPPISDAINPKVIAALKAGSVDVTKLPDTLDEVATSPSKLEAVMESFTIALGTSCDGCHASSGSRIDYEAETPNKNIAKKMWSTIVRGLQRTDGSAIYCDSCHQGKMQFLDRADDRALSAWMQTEFVDKLARRDGKDHTCATCHGEPFVNGLMEQWAK